MTEDLIESVRCEPSLYDTNHPDYSKKTLKDLLWVRIARKLNYKDGPSAKDAWQKLRSCHRDATRRRQRLYRNGAADTIIKPWKYESQMEFLMTYMTNRSTSGDMPTGNSSHDQNPIQPEDLINYQEDGFANYEPLQNEASSPHITSNNLNEHSLVSFQLLPPDNTGINSTKDSAVSQLVPSPLLQTDMPCKYEAHTVKETTEKKNDITTLIANMLQNHENRAKERAEKKAQSDEVDEMQHFFNTMYAITKKMPPLSQLKLKRQIFNLVSNEEEYLLPTSKCSK